MAVRLRVSKPKKNKGKAKPLTLNATNTAREDLSYLCPTTAVPGSNLHNVPLKTDAGVPLEPMRSLRHQSHQRLRLRDEVKEGIKGGEGATLRPKEREDKRLLR